MSTRLSLPVRIGLLFAALGLALTIVGIVSGNVPSQPLSILVALLIGGGVWFVVAWAVATAAVDVERDIAAADGTDDSGAVQESVTATQGPDAPL